MSTELNAQQQAAADEADAYLASICQRCGVPWEFHVPLMQGQACRADIAKMVAKIHHLEAVAAAAVMGETAQPTPDPAGASGRDAHDRARRPSGTRYEDHMTDTRTIILTGRSPIHEEGWPEITVDHRDDDDNAATPSREWRRSLRVRRRAGGRAIVYGIYDTCQQGEACVTAQARYLLPDTPVATEIVEAIRRVSQMLADAESDAVGGSMRAAEIWQLVADECIAGLAEEV